MTTKVITKELNLLDIEDIESAVSKHAGREVKIGEMDCSLAYCIPMDSNEPSGAYFELSGFDDEVDSYELFYDDELECHVVNGKPLSLDAEPWLPVEDIFNFDVSAFKSFETWTDTSD